MNTFLNLQQVIPRIYKSPFCKPLNWEVKEGEAWSIVGRNGSGKTLLAEIICGKYNLIEGKIDYPFLESIKQGKEVGYQDIKQFIRIISFNSVYSIVDFREMYYQQRFNSTENDEWIIHLSSGELRKFLIDKVILENPRMIIFDNPFIGLDSHSRKQLDETFHSLSKSGIQLFFLIPSIHDMPTVTSHILEIDNGEITGRRTIHEVDAPSIKHSTNPFSVDWNLFPSTPRESDVVVKMENITISYDKRVIATEIDWEIKRGEKWALIGPNGSGKSTLLSYIYADNPQAYSKKLLLFDHKRGTGESIWDIKKRIGFTSSEIHLYYRENVSCLKVIESGFFDSIGLYRKCTDEQTALADYLLNLLNIVHLRERSFLKISSGEQRLVLFARSLVKNPELLILDEPFHGLDEENKQRCLQVVESYGQQPNKSLIFVTHQYEEIPNSVEYYLKLTK
jgi:molybdate transport system ATP-binding protein